MLSYLVTKHQVARAGFSGYTSVVREGKPLTQSSAARHAFAASVNRSALDKTVTKNENLTYRCKGKIQKHPYFCIQRLIFLPFILTDNGQFKISTCHDGNSSFIFASKR